MLPLRLGKTEVSATHKSQECGRMVYNELEQEDILSAVRVGLAPIAYTDILLRSIWAMHKNRQSPVLYLFRAPQVGPSFCQPGSPRLGRSPTLGTTA